MTKLKVGDRVKMSDKGKEVWGNGEHNPHSLEGVLTRSAPAYYGSMKYGVKWDNDATNSYNEGDLELVVEEVATPVITQEQYSWIDSLNKAQLRNLKAYLGIKLDTEEVVLYSVTGRKWGKKRVPETKLKMTYKMVNGKIQGQPRVARAFNG